MSRRSRAVASVAGATVLAAAAFVGGAVSAQAANYGVVSASSALTDFAPGTANPTDHAWATVVVAEKGNRSSYVMVVTGVDAPAGTTFGAHVHVGPCVAGEPTTAGAHWRTSPSDPADANHEVWLDFTVGKGGAGTAKAKVPFVVPDGAARSVVVHAMATAPGGGAGARLACLPIDL